MNQRLVCDIKLSEQLKRAGVEQDSMFYWIYRSEPGKLMRQCTKLEYKGEWPTRNMWREKKEKEGIRTDITSAFTSEELALKIPQGISHTKRYSNKFFVYFLDSQGEIVNYESDETESEARGKMLLRLIKHKFIKP